MVNTRRTNSTPIPRQDETLPQNNVVTLQELRDLVVSIDRRVKRNEDELAAKRGQGDNHAEENGINEEAPSDHQSGGDNRRGTELGGNGGSHSQHHSPSITQVWANFRKFNPLMFEGKLYLAEAVEWLRRLERIFKVVECTSQQRVLVAEQLLQKAAQEWLDSTKLDDDIDTTWEEFKEKFLQHYFPLPLEQRKRLSSLPLNRVIYMKMNLLLAF